MSAEIVGRFTGHDCDLPSHARVGDVAYCDECATHWLCYVSDRFDTRWQKLRGRKLRGWKRRAVISQEGE